MMTVTDRDKEEEIKRLLNTLELTKQHQGKLGDGGGWERNGKKRVITIGSVAGAAMGVETRDV